MLEAAEDWLYEDGADLGYKEYQEKQYGLMTKQTVYKKRKEQHKLRTELLDQILEDLTAQASKVDALRESMPWVTEQEQSDLREKIDEFRAWLESQIESQEKLALDEDPAFSMDEVEAKLKKVQALAKKVYNKKKPREPKKPKADKKEEEKAEEEAQKEDNEESQN